MTNEAKNKIYEGEIGVLYKVVYFPEWAKKYPMWLNKILFWLFNHGILRKLEKYL